MIKIRKIWKIDTFIFLVFIILSMFGVFVSAQNIGSISGKVTPAEAGIKVRAIQNPSLVSETTTDEEGNYKIIDLTPGKYGLLFIKGELVYIYNDKINPLLELVVNETIIVATNQDSSGYDIDLNEESEDYIVDRIGVTFKSGLSVDRMTSIIDYYNCTTVYQPIKDGIKRYVLDIPDNKTALEMINLFELNPHVKSAHLTLTTYTVEPPIKENITEEIKECVKENQELYGPVPHYVLGYMAVIFKEKVTEEEAITLIESYNLSIYKNKFPSYIGVIIAEGTEIEWKCILEENEIVKYGALITSGTTMKLGENVTEEIVASLCGNGICESEENCENCIADCACSEQEECIEGECKIKEIVHPRKFTWLWVTIITIIIVLIILILIIRNKRK